MGWPYSKHINEEIVDTIAVLSSYTLDQWQVDVVDARVVGSGRFRHVTYSLLNATLEVIRSPQRVILGCAFPESIYVALLIDGCVIESVRQHPTFESERKLLQLYHRFDRSATLRFAAVRMAEHQGEELGTTVIRPLAAAPS